MRRLFSRYGGGALVIGKGKASDALLPEDQSLDNLLDHHAQEPVENIFYLSSYRMLPEFMGAMSPLPKGLTKVGVMHHLFTEMILQQDVNVETSIYLGTHHYPNVYVLLIHTDESDLQLYLGLESNKKVYDYVLTFFMRGIEDGKDNLKDSPEQLEMMLLILAYEMGLSYTELEFTPSGTPLGKRIAPDLQERINRMLMAEEPEEALKKELEACKTKLLGRK
jgi:hypothetical protein